jgi:HEAT repeat protein
MNAPEYSIDDIINMIKSRDAVTYENGYELIQPIVHLHVPQLIQLLSESNDGYTRGKFIELLGEAKDKKAISVLVGELKHPDQNVRQWALTSLTKIGGLTAWLKVTQYKLLHRKEFT